jgi:hypothetical protein
MSFRSDGLGGPCYKPVNPDGSLAIPVTSPGGSFVTLLSPLDSSSMNQTPRDSSSHVGTPRDSSSHVGTPLDSSSHVGTPLDSSSSVQSALDVPSSVQSALDVPSSVQSALGDSRFEEDTRRREKEELASAELISASLARGDYHLCTCDSLIQKDGGCNWVKCARCGREWCWVTKLPKGEGEGHCPYHGKHNCH